MCAKHDNMTKYRIHRTDSRNIAIQKKTGNEWRVVSYHGNNIRSLTTGLSGLLITDHKPEDESLAQQLKSLERAVSDNMSEIEKMVSSMV